MYETINLNCPNCGGELEIETVTEIYICNYCGTKHLVQKKDGGVFLQPVIQELSKVQSGIDRASSELAILRLNSEIKDLEEKRLSLSSNSRSSSKNSCINYLMVFGLLGAALTLIAMILNAPEVALVSILVGLISMLFSRFLSIKDQKKLKEALLSLEENIILKRKELEFHKNNVRISSRD